jgi:hypothetical protein
MTTSSVLTGLDGANPLGFLAALGVLAASDTAAPGSQLSWKNEGRWRPVLISSLDRASLLECLAADLRTWDDDRAVRLSYEKPVKDGTKKKSSEPKVTQDLKPRPEKFRAYLQDLIGDADTTILPVAFLHRPRRPLDYASAFGTDVAVDNNKNVKPTALHFTAGQQEFLKSVLELIEGVNNADLEEALFGPWQYIRELPVLSWDSSVSRDYALRADDPSKSKKTGVPGADWLAFRGLAFVPVAPMGSEIQAAGCSGGWKFGGAFTWPLWNGALSVSAVRSIMTLAGLVGLSAHERRVRGIEVVLRSGIRRSDQGGYGSFLPADVRPPGKR